MDIPWNPKVPGTMGWVGQFLAFPDIYGGVNLHSLLHLYKTYLASPLKLVYRLRLDTKPFTCIHT